MKAVTRRTEILRYIPLDDRALPSDQQSVFVLRPLTQAERMAVLDEYSWVTIENDGTRRMSDRGFQQARTLVLSHVEAVENFPVGAPAPWPAEKAARERYLEQLDDFVVFEIGNEIREHSTGTFDPSLAQAQSGAPAVSADRASTTEGGHEHE